MPRLALLLCLAFFVAAPAAHAQGPDSVLRRSLVSAMSAAGPGSGAYVRDVSDVSDGRTLFEWRAGSARVLASNAKLFTTVAALDRLGARATLPTRVLGAGSLDLTGRWRGNLYLRGGGDPTFGSRSFVRRAYALGAEVEDLAVAVEAAGIYEVTGSVVGDESLFDSLRGGPYSSYGVSRYVGPLSALAFNRGLANDRGTAFQAAPAAFAAARLERELRRLGIRVRGAPRAGRAPAGATEVAAVESPPVSRLVQITNKRSDNFFAETLLKVVASADAPAGLRSSARGSTPAGARVAERVARRFGARVRLADGSGLSRGNRASPRAVGTLLERIRRWPEFRAFYDSLAIAGRDGTLHDRMRRGPARGRCRAKTGTLVDVSTLSGYCNAPGGRTLVFSFLMNGVRPRGARRLQDRMAHALARYAPSGALTPPPARAGPARR